MTEPSTKKTSIGVKIVAGLIVVGVIGAVMSKPEPKKSHAQREADARVTAVAVGAANIKRSAKDPESFQIESALLMDNGAACYDYRAKNSFAAMVPGQAVLTHDGMLVLSSAKGFEAAWSAECGGKSGRDVTAGVNFTL